MRRSQELLLCQCERYGEIVAYLLQPGADGGDRSSSEAFTDIAEATLPKEKQFSVEFPVYDSRYR